MREARWDNLRYLAGTGVLLIHTTETLPNPDGLHWIYLATWAMRIPLFALLAGYFSSAAPLTGTRAWRLSVMVVLPFLAVQLVASLEILAMWGVPGGDRLWTEKIHNPGWTLWFLQALFLWRVALPWLARLRYPLATSVAVALAAGYFPIGPLPFELSRTIGFLPFFLLGWKLRQGDLDGWLRAGWTRGPAAGVLGVTFVAAWLGRNHVDRELLTFQRTYEELGVPLHATLAWGFRCAMLLGGMAVALSLIRLAPRRRLPLITYLGSGGLYIYLLHGFLLRPLNAAEAFAWVDTWPDQAAVVAFAIAASAALASPPVRRLSWPIVQPRLAQRLRLSPGRRPRVRGSVRVPLGRGSGA
jgi:fucose 4-O-acetylase-like acetyltransferase